MTAEPGTSRNQLIVIRDPRHLAETLHNARLERGQTLHSLAVRAGITEARVGEWLRGTRVPMVPSLIRLAPALGWRLALIPDDTDRRTA